MPSHYENRDIFEAAENDDPESVKHFVEDEHVPVTTANVIGVTAAHIAASRGQLDILKYLVEKDASLVEMSDMWNQTTLHMAARKGSLKVVEYLVDTCNASVHPLSHIFQCNSVLHVAAECGHLKVVQYFVEEKNMDVNERNSEGQPPIFLAASHDHVHVVEYLMDEANADVMMVDNEKSNILHACVQFGYRRVPSFLLDQRKLPFDLNARNVNGRSVLYTACLHKNSKFVKYLVEKKHADVNSTDNFGWTPLHQAANLSDWKLVEYLIKHGADPKIADSEGRTALNLTTNEQITKHLKEAMRNRNRRSVTELFGSHLQQREEYTEVARLESSSFRPISYDIHLCLTLASFFVRLFKRSTLWMPEVELATPRNIRQSRINSVVGGIVHSISCEEYSTNYN